MTQQKNTWMRLRQAPDSRKKNNGWIFQVLVSMLSSSCMVLSLTGITQNPWPVMLVVSLSVCVFYGVFVKSKQEGWFYIVGLFLALALSLIFRKQILEGFCIFWNNASDAMVSGRGWVLREWELKLGKPALCSGLFGALCACIISMICCGLTSLAPAALAVGLPGVMMVGMMVFGTEAGILRVFAVSVLILIYGGLQKKNAKAAILASWTVCTVVAILLFAITQLPGMQNWTAQVREDVHKTIHRSKYETKYTTLPEGDFSDYQKTDRKPEPALAVTMDDPQMMYLRGFTGAVFEEDGWKPLDTQALAKNKDLLYWLNLNAFDQNAQFDAASAVMEQSTVTVQNIGACSYYLYVPFSIGSGSWTQPENLNTDGVHGEGQRDYVYTVTAGDSDAILQVLNELQISNDPTLLQYRRAESGYWQFVSHYYLQVPEEVKKLLQDQWDAVASAYGDANHLTKQQAQECTLIFLSRCFTEDGTPENVELPLAVAEGTSFQYATVAAMTCRYFGIPSRYAEGYVISQEMAADYESGEKMTVDSSCARAWVEVYQDGIGWIPMDLTPGIGEILENPDSEKPNENDASNKDTTEKEEPEEQEQPQPNGGSMVLVILKTVLWSVLSMIGIGLLVFLVLWIRRKVLLNRREKKFADENISDAVAWIYGDTSLILEKIGFNRGNGSMRSLRQPLEERYGAEFGAQFEWVSDLNDLALFSHYPLTEEDRTALRQFRTLVLQKLKTEVKWYRRMWLQWAKCLY